MLDVILEVIRAAITGIILIYLVLVGKKRILSQQTGWNYIVIGFALILFGTLIDITDNFPSLDKYIIVGDTGVQAFLEKVVGYLFGFLFLAIGLLRWMPSVMVLWQTERDMLRMLNRAVEQSPTTVLITDTRGNIEYVNPQFSKLTGYTYEESIGRNANIVKSGNHPPEFYKHLWKTITSGKEWRGEFHNRKKNGELYWESASISPVIEENLAITHFIAVKEDITERKRMEDALKQLAETDNLTQVYNRTKFDEIMRREMERVKRFDHSLSIIIFDIDHFKRTNDRYGHNAGDNVLKSIAGLAKELAREIDYIIRWGGEEFIIITPETSPQDAEVLAERLRDSIESHEFDQVGKITASFGVTEFKKDENETSVVKRADEALYRAKSNGRNRVEVNL